MPPPLRPFKNEIFSLNLLAIERNAKKVHFLPERILIFGRLFPITFIDEADSNSMLR